MAGGVSRKRLYQQDVPRQRPPRLFFKRYHAHGRYGGDLGILRLISDFIIALGVACCVDFVQYV